MNLLSVAIDITGLVTFLGGAALMVKAAFILFGKE